MGLYLEKVEHWKPGGQTRRSDLFGFVDLHGYGRGRFWYVQATTTANQAARVKKIMLEPCRTHAIELLVHGADIEVWGWLNSKDGEYKLTRTSFELKRVSGDWDLETRVIDEL